MPSIPIIDRDPEEQSNAEVIRDIARSALAATVPKEVGRRAWIALGVLLVVVATHPEVIAIASGAAAILYLAVDLTRVGKR